jgi:hypothetical protein
MQNGPAAEESFWVENALLSGFAVFDRKCRTKVHNQQDPKAVI